MVSLVMQSTVVSLNKVVKASKSSSSLNTPLAEEEESHSEKEASGDVLLFSEDHSFIADLRPDTTLAWPDTKQACIFHSSEILIPPPKI